MVVFGCVFVVHDNRNAEFAFKIEEVFFFIADYDGDITADPLPLSDDDYLTIFENAWR